MPGNPIFDRVLITTDTIGEIWTFTMNLTRQLASMDIQVALATMGKKPTVEQYQEVSKISGVTLYESNFKLEWMDDPWDDISKAGEWLLHVEEIFQPSIVHLNSYSFATLPWKNPVVLTCHSCLYSWWLNVNGSLPPHGSRNEYYKKVSTALQAVDNIVAVSHAFARQIAQIYPIPLQKIKVVYNGLYPSDYSPGKKREVILGLGRAWDQAKNFKVIQKFAPTIPWPVKIAGNYHHSDFYNGTFINSELPVDAISKKKVKAALTEASIYILPAYYEPFGVSALEAALSSCALVLSGIPTLKEIWKDAALYVPPDDAQGWSGILNKLIEDESLRNYMANAAFIRAQHFTIQSTAKQYLSLYNKIKTQTTPVYEN
jgi:glycosyltransferase involved in cell wall biosynthesis